MKGLFTTSLIIVALIAVGIGISLILNSDLNDKLNAAYQRGDEEGRTQGYLVGFQDGNKAGYQEGGKIGYEGGNQVDDTSSNETGFYFVYNPTYDEVKEILAENGKASAKEIQDYAEANGIRVAYVRVPIARQAREGMVYLYQLVAFETVDRGLVIIEPWSHREVEIEVGKSYSGLNHFRTSPYDDTITKVTIVW